MQFNKFEIVAFPKIVNAYCKCGNSLEQVSNGWFSKALYCPKCENVYGLKLVKFPDKQVDEKFLEQCRKEVK